MKTQRIVQTLLVAAKIVQRLSQRRPITAYRQLPSQAADPFRDAPITIPQQLRLPFGERLLRRHAPRSKHALRGRA